MLCRAPSRLCPAVPCLLPSASAMGFLYSKSTKKIRMSLHLLDGVRCFQSSSCPSSNAVYAYMVFTLAQFRNDQDWGVFCFSSLLV